MKTIDHFREQLARIGATLAVDDYTMNADAPSGYVWRANGCTAVCIPYASNRQQWLVAAVRDAMPTLRMGLDKVTDEKEIAETRHLLDDDTWGATVEAPDRIEWRDK